MNFEEKCIVCGHKSDENNIVTVNVDNVKYRVALCDDEDLTLKQIKKLVSDKLSKLNKLLEELGDFGYSIDDLKSGISVVNSSKDQQQPEEEPDSQPKPEKSQGIVLTNEQGKVVAEKKAGKQVRIANPKSVPKVRLNNLNTKGLSPSKQLEVDESFDPVEAVSGEIRKSKKKGEDVEFIPETKEVEMQTVRGRGGQPMRIPKTIKHNIGSTVINVVDTGGDKTIQDRFKEFAKHTKESGIEGHIYGRDGMDTADCTMCSGSGIARAGGQCKKCGGTGILERGWNKGG